MERSYFGPKPLLNRTRQAPRLNIRIGLGGNDDDEENPIVTGKNNTVGRRVKNGGLAGIEFRPDRQPGKIVGTAQPKVVNTGRETPRPQIKIGPKRGRPNPEEDIKKRRYNALTRRYARRTRA